MDQNFFYTHMLRSSIGPKLFWTGLNYFERVHIVLDIVQTHCEFVKKDIKDLWRYLHKTKKFGNGQES